MLVYEQVFVSNFECAETGIVVLVAVVVVIVVPVVILVLFVLLVSAGLLKSMMVHALINRGYGIQTCNIHRCQEGHEAEEERLQK
jgi:hypothetical protein